MDLASSSHLQNDDHRPMVSGRGIIIHCKLRRFATQQLGYRVCLGLVPMPLGLQCEKVDVWVAVGAGEEERTQYHGYAVWRCPIYASVSNHQGH
jgi:hypothetical protein